MEAIIGIVMILLLLAGRYYVHRREVEWEQRRSNRPPISDEEYLRLFNRPVDPEIAFGVREVLSEALGIDEAEIYPDSELVRDLGA